MILSLKNTTFGLLIYVKKRTLLLCNSRFTKSYKYKFQGREYQEELALNVYPFKFRTYDPAIGRFWSIDPVSENYPYNGVYNFAENRVVESIDLEGKESWFTQNGSLATKAGPYTKDARKQIGLYSPSEVQQMKANSNSNPKGPTFSQDKLSPLERKNQERLAKIPTSAPNTETTSKANLQEKFVQTTKEYSEVAETTSQAGQLTAVVVGIVGVVTLQPEIVAGAIAMFEGFSVVGGSGKAAKTVSLAVDGKNTEATLEGTNFAFGLMIGSWANSIPGADAVTKETVKTTTEAIIETGKKEVEEELNIKQ